MVPDSSEPSTFFCYLLELNNMSASAILDSVLHCLCEHRLTWECLLQNLISFSADGASYMLRRKKDAATLLVELFPYVLIWHWCNHNLEPLIMWNVSLVNSLNLASPKDWCELREFACSLSLRSHAAGYTVNSIKCYTSLCCVVWIQSRSLVISVPLLITETETVRR